MALLDFIKVRISTLTQKKNLDKAKRKRASVQVLIWRKVKISSWYQNIAKLLVMEEVLITWKIVDLVFFLVSFVGSFSNLALLFGNFDSWKWKKSCATFVLGGVNKWHDNGVYV